MSFATKLSGLKKRGGISFMNNLGATDKRHINTAIYIYAPKREQQETIFFLKKTFVCIT